MNRCSKYLLGYLAIYWKKMLIGISFIVQLILITCVFWTVIWYIIFIDHFTPIIWKTNLFLIYLIILGLLIKQVIYHPLKNDIFFTVEFRRKATSNTLTFYYFLIWQMMDTILYSQPISATQKEIFAALYWPIFCRLIRNISFTY